MFIYSKKLKLNFDVMAVMAVMAVMVVTADFHSLQMFVYSKKPKLNFDVMAVMAVMEVASVTASGLYRICTCLVYSTLGYLH